MWLSCTDSAVAERARLRINLSKNARLKMCRVGVSSFTVVFALGMTNIYCFSRFSDVFLVDASNEETITSDLKSIALARKIGESEQDTLDWLSTKRDEWLLLLNNADNTTFNLRTYCPICYHGNILITTRNRNIRDFAPQSNIQISGMEPEEARNLLLTRAGLGELNHNVKALAMTIVRVNCLTSSRMVSALTFIQELGYLALAVVQAGAYISRTGCALNHYLKMYQKLLKTYRHDIQQIDDYDKTVYTTWKISFELLSPPAARYLQLCAFMHHDGIFEAIFYNAACNCETFVPITDKESASFRKAKDFLDLFGAIESAWDAEKFLEAVSEIQSYSLIDYDAANQTYSIHPLVQAYIRTTIDNGELTRTIIRCILGMSIGWKYQTEDYAFRRMLLPHINAALEGGTLTEPHACAKLGFVYSENGQWGKAESLQVTAADTWMQVRGAEHQSTLTSMANLASTFSNQGRWKEAEVLEVQVMETRKRLLGEEHPSTLTSMANLASTYRNQGRWKEAEVLEVQVMETRKRLLGEEHPSTLMSMANLASTFWNQGRWKEAEVLEIQVMDTSKRLLGEEHPDTLTSITNLALTYRNQGQWREAEVLEVQVMETRKRLLGAEHPDMLTSMANLGHTLKLQDHDAQDIGELDEAFSQDARAESQF